MDSELKVAKSEHRKLELITRMSKFIRREKCNSHNFINKVAAPIKTRSTHEAQELFLSAVCSTVKLNVLFFY